MVSFKNILYKVQESLSAYEDYEVVDESSLRIEAVKHLKQFGPLVTVTKNKTLVVSDYTAQLPFYFYRLDKVSRCGVTEYEIKGNPPTVLTQTVMKVREELPVENKSGIEYFNPDGKYKRITETMYLDNPNSVTANIIVKDRITIVPHIGADICLNCDDISPELQRTGNKVAVMGNTLETDFREGIIYIEYQAYPEDREGELIINDGGNGQLEDYIYYSLMHYSYLNLWEKYKLDVKTRIDKYSVLKGQSEGRAMVALKSKGMVDGSYIKPIKKFNKNKLRPYREILRR